MLLLADDLLDAITTEGGEDLSRVFEQAYPGIVVQAVIVIITTGYQVGEPFGPAISAFPGKPHTQVSQFQAGPPARVGDQES